MKVRGQMVTDDGFDKNVADRMPKVKQEEGFSLPNQEAEIQGVEEDHQEMIQEVRPPEKESEREVGFEPRKITPEADRSWDVSRLIEDLHNQLLALGQTKRALEMDLASNQKTIHQLAQDNRELRGRLADSNKEIQSLKEVQAETIYLKEENTDALGRIQEFQKELKVIRETLELTTRERDEALSRIQDLESQIEQSEILRVKGKMKEREASLFADENRELRTRLEEVLAQNMDLERKYGDMRQSFHEVKESLTLLRDSCKTDYYNL